MARHRGIPPLALDGRAALLRLIRNMLPETHDLIPPIAVCVPVQPC